VTDRRASGDGSLSILASVVASRDISQDRLGALRGTPIEILVREDLTMSSAPIAVETFGRLGFDARLVVEDDADLVPERILFVAGNPLSYRKTLKRLSTMPRAGRPLVIVFHTEPLPMPAAAGLRPQALTAREVAKILLHDRRVNDPASNARFARSLVALDVVDVYAVATRAYQAFLAEQGIDTIHVPLGYHESYGRSLGLERDIDVLFLGDYKLRRRASIFRRLRSEGLEVLTVGSYTEKGYWGDARTELVNRAKIYLNVPRYEGHLPDLRLVVGMANEALVVSETLYLPGPYVPGVHYVEAPLAGLAELIRTYLADGAERRRIAAAGHAFVTEELTLEGAFTTLLEHAAHVREPDGP
jgi:glycosyl transferase family 1